nr:MAG TPA: hypothetical protein [Caudoviricetes sp.]
MPWIDAGALKEKYADQLSVQRVFGYDAGFVAGILAALEMPTLTPPNEPLTLEELREMDEPVWVACKPIEGGNGYWCLCQHGHIITPAGSIYNVKEIPHWVFYRRPPEGEDET